MNYMNKLNQPLVSICTTTYNREKYIGEAIESCMMQKTNFPFEMVISDNCSTDKTVEIIESYIQKFPDKIRLLKSDKNYGLMLNYIKSIEAGTGKYIADCDGDDYWIDEYKLQKQVDFLEANPDYVMVFTNSLIRYNEKGEEQVAKIKIWDTCNASQLIEHNSIEGVLYGETINSPGHISSILFRNNVLGSFPDWYYTCYINDEPLFLMLSKFGKAKFINDLSTVYRINPLGISTDGFSFETDILGRIAFYKNIDKFHEFQYHKQINSLISKYYLKLAKLYFNGNERLKAVLNLIVALRYDIRSLQKIKEKIN